MRLTNKDACHIPALPFVFNVVCDAYLEEHVIFTWKGTINMRCFVL
jgi:hypothetical protein